MWACLVIEPPELDDPVLELDIQAQLFVRGLEGRMDLAGE